MSRPTARGLPVRKPEEGDIQRARILVGPWKRWRNRPWPHRIEQGARYSGVFARFANAGDSLRLLNWYDRTVRVARAGMGLVGAMRPTEEDLLWVVTGVDDEGVEHAARALDSDDLLGAFALTATREGLEKVPLRPD